MLRWLRRTTRGLLLLLTLTLLVPPAYAQTTVTCAAEAIVQPGETLSTLAGRFYGNAAAYGAIVAATNAKAAVDTSYTAIADANRLGVGWKLCIPNAGATLPSAATNLQPTPLPTATTPALPTPTPTPLPNGMHPLMIEYMRTQSYPGSELVVEEVLAPGVNYDRSIVSYQSEGNKIYALLTVPRGAKPATGWPVVIFNHGYIPPEQYRTTERYVAYVDGFARNGYIVLRSDYRGHGFSEGEANGAYGSPDYTIDVLNAVTAIKGYPAADPNRIGMWGHSMGGYITLRAMVLTKEIKVGVIWAGVVASYPDLLTRWRRPATTPPPDIPQRARRWRDELIATYGTPEQNPKFWASISANSYLKDLSGPIQLHHGTADESVPFEFSTLLEGQIQAVGGSVEIYGYEGDNHNLANNFTTAMTRSVAFFDQYLK